MASHRPTCPSRSFQRQHLVCVVLFFQAFCLLPTIADCETQHGSDPYDELYDVIMVRKDSNGDAYATNEVGPLIYGRSKFHLTTRPFQD